MFLFRRIFFKNAWVFKKIIEIQDHKIPPFRLILSKLVEIFHFRIFLKVYIYNNNEMTFLADLIKAHRLLRLINTFLFLNYFHVEYEKYIFTFKLSS